MMSLETSGAVSYVPSPTYLRPSHAHERFIKI